MIACRSIFFGLGLVAVTGSAHAAAVEAGRLTKVTGDVFVRAPGGSEGPAKMGASLIAGTHLRTAPNAQAEVTFDDGSLLRLSASSSIQLSANKRQKKKSSVLLFFGKLWSKVTPSTTGEPSYEVATANAVCGVRGTEFETQVGDDGSLRMRVTEGKVAVDGEEADEEELAGPGEEVEADESGVDDTTAAKPGNDAEWQAQKRERVRTEGAGLVKSIKGKIMTRKAQLETLLTQEKDLEAKRAKAEERARSGDKDAITEIKRVNQELAVIADAIADLGDEATAQFGLVDHFADLAADPRFKMINRKTLEAEAQSLRRIKADLDKLVADGTDLSIEAMDKLLDDMGKGKGGGLRNKKGSTTKDLFGPDDMDLR